MSETAERFRKTVAIDFDGVIHRYSKGWHDGTCYDEPMPGAFEAIRALRSKGFHVVIFTARNTGDVGQWLVQHWPEGKSFGDAPEATNTKPAAVAYIDDRAIRFTNWRDVLNYF